MLIYGVNPVIEALRARRVASICIAARDDDRLRLALRLAGDQGIPVRRVGPDELDHMVPSQGRRRVNHQGIVAETHGSRLELGVADLVSAAAGPALIVVLDGIEDPHNVGAILRTVDAAGGDGVIRQSRRAAPLDGAAAKASAGAVAHVRVADVVNIARALEELKEAGVWTVGLAEDAAQAYDQLDLTLPTAFVVGAEGHGLRRLVRERCDWLASIPMRGQVGSLNVSVATGIALFEAIRQRQRRAPPAPEGPDLR